MRFEIHVSENIHHLRLTEDTIVFNIAPLYLGITAIDDEDRIDVDLHHTSAVLWGEILNKHIKANEPKEEDPGKRLLRVPMSPQTLDDYLAGWLMVANDVVNNTYIDPKDLPRPLHPYPGSLKNKEVYFINKSKVEIVRCEKNLRYLSKQQSNSTLVRELLQYVPHLYIYTPPKPTYRELEFVLVKAGEELYDKRGLVTVVPNALIGIDVWVYSKQVEQLINDDIIPNSNPDASVTKITSKTQVRCVGYTDTEVLGSQASDLYEWITHINQDLSNS